eukprot:gene19-314_t
MVAERGAWPMLPGAAGTSTEATAAGGDACAARPAFPPGVPVSSTQRSSSTDGHYSSDGAAPNAWLGADGTQQHEADHPGAVQVFRAGAKRPYSPSSTRRSCETPRFDYDDEILTAWPCRQDDEICRG